jgi:hypothetical protein
MWWPLTFTGSADSRAQAKRLTIVRGIVMVVD